MDLGFETAVVCNTHTHLFYDLNCPTLSNLIGTFIQIELHYCEQMIVKDLAQRSDSNNPAVIRFKPVTYFFIQYLNC